MLRDNLCTDRFVYGKRRISPPCRVIREITDEDKKKYQV